MVTNEPNIFFSDHRPYRWTRERRKLNISTIGWRPPFDLGTRQAGRMAVQLRYAGLQSREQAEQIGFIHSATLMQAKQMIRVGNTGTLQLFLCRPGERV